MSDAKNWPPEAAELLERAIHRHGSRATWERLTSLPFQFNELSGLVPWMKGYPFTFKMPATFEVRPRERRVFFHEYPEPGCLGEYHNGSVRITTPQRNTRVLVDRPRARNHYRGWRKLAFWEPADAMYFFGYAMTTYFSVPFVLPACELIAHIRLQQDAETWDGLKVRFTDDFDTHCPVQTFYFDATGLLRRHDYHADIIGRWAMGAHYSHDYAEFKGIQVSGHREVYVRLGTQALPIKALHGSFSPQR